MHKIKLKKFLANEIRAHISEKGQKKKKKKKPTQPNHQNFNNPPKKPPPTTTTTQNKNSLRKIRQKQKPSQNGAYKNKNKNKKQIKPTH